MTPPDPGAPHVLVVDDDPAIVRIIVRFLERIGYRVSSAGSADEAWLRLEERVDALVLDLRIPGMRGDALYYLASARQPWLTARALFMTGDITEDAEFLVAQTRCDLLPKPFPFEALRDALARIAPVASARVPRVG